MPRLLIVEDDSELQGMLSVLFNKEGYELDYAFNGKDGYQKILSFQPDIVLLDLMMPVMDGIQVIKLVLSNPAVKDIPIIVMTAYGDQAEMLEGPLRAQGVREYLRKPFDLEDVRKLVARMLLLYPRDPNRRF